MTTTIITPSKAKSWVALLGSLLAVGVPLLVEVKDVLPDPWPALLGGVIAVLTMFGVYQAPYKPADTVIVPTASVPNTPPPDSGLPGHPWK